MFRNYQPDYGNRNVAQAYQGKANDAAMMSGMHQNYATANPVSNAVGDPRRRSHYNAPPDPYAMQAMQHQREANVAAGNAMFNESVQAQDRQMDLAEQEQALKYGLQRRQQDTELAKERARMGAVGNMINGLGIGNLDSLGVPDVNLYGNNGQRIGGSMFRQALLG